VSVALVMMRNAKLRLKRTQGGRAKVSAWLALQQAADDLGALPPMLSECKSRIADRARHGCLRTGAKMAFYASTCTLDEPFQAGLSWSAMATTRLR
jgi:hypothetical protein